MLSFCVAVIANETCNLLLVGAGLKSGFVVLLACFRPSFRESSAEKHILSAQTFSLESLCGDLRERERERERENVCVCEREKEKFYCESYCAYKF